jgi:large subunit ribosomal protein L25
VFVALPIFIEPDVESNEAFASKFTIFAGAALNTIKRTVKYLCPADIIPPYIDVDLSELDVGQKVLMGDLNVHPALKLLHSKDDAVCKIMGQRVSETQPKKSK